MKLALDSDFRDYYDHWFDYFSVGGKPEQTLRRQSRQGLPKRDQFTLLEECGFTVPLHGHVFEVAPNVTTPWLVVYDDEMAHCGEGKALWHRTKASLEVPNQYCSVFIPSTEDPVVHAVSMRLLAIGDRLWWLKYESNGWMSNHADNVDVTVIGETLSREQYALEESFEFGHLGEYPLFAIDFVKAKDGRLMAIDFNSAPGLKGTGMENLMPSKGVVEAIKSYLTAHHPSAS